MGIATDDGENMTGRDAGVGRKLKDVYNHIVNMKNISHALNGILKKGLKVIPKDILNIINNICSHFSHSTQMRALLRQISLENQIKSLEILQLSGTRWLSLRNCLDRILELWAPLELYFLTEGNNSQKKYFSEENELYLRYGGKGEVIVSQEEDKHDAEEEYDSDEYYTENEITLIKCGKDTNSLKRMMKMKKSEGIKKTKLFEELNFIQVYASLN